MSVTDTSVVQFGSFRIEVEHHEWNCGDDCCSSSGNTAEVFKGDNYNAIFSCGDPDLDGYMDAETYAHHAIDLYLQQRDHEARNEGAKNSYKNHEAELSKSNTRFSGLAMAYNFIRNLNDDSESSPFRTTLRGKEYASKSALMEKALFNAAGPDGHLLYMYDHQYKEAIGNDQ